MTFFNLEEALRWGQNRTRETAMLKNYKCRSIYARRMRTIASQWTFNGIGVCQFTIAELRKAYRCLVPASWDENDPIGYYWCIYYNVISKRPEFLKLA